MLSYKDLELHTAFQKLEKFWGDGGNMMDFTIFEDRRIGLLLDRLYIHVFIIQDGISSMDREAYQ
jgi:hypothetical protein